MRSHLLEQTSHEKNTFFECTNPPDWVIDVPFDSNTLHNDGDLRGIKYLLSDHQVFIKDSSTEFYTKNVKEIFSETGLEEISHFACYFNPSYEKIYLHELKIIRKNKIIDLLISQNILVMDDENQISGNIINNEKIIYILLNDLRVGDLIISSYTSIGTNKIFNNKFHQIIDLNYFARVDRFYRRFIWPLSKTIFYRVSNSHIIPQASPQEIIIDIKNLLPIESDPNTPSWYCASGFLELTEYTCWKEVVDWGLKNFSISNDAEAQLHNICSEIKEKFTSKEEQIIAALRFVQNNIRYTALSFGEASHKPYTPNVTINRRFGDCKDKSLLFVNLLNILEIESAVALVSTSRLHQITNLLPSPTLFNHAIVCVFLGDKKYWFDTTATHEGGNLHASTQAFFGSALILSPHTTSLVSCPRNALSDPEVEIFETYKILPEDLSTLFLTIKTIYKFESANRFRYRIAVNGLKKIQEQFHDFITPFFRDIQIEQPISIEDDTERNEIVIVETYKTNLCNELDHGSYIEKVFYIKATEIKPYLYYKPLATYKDPLELPFPNYISRHAEVKAPYDIPIQSSEYTIDNEYLLFYDEIKKENNTLLWKQIFKIKKDHIEPHDISNYYEDLDHISDHCTLGISQIYPKIEKNGSFTHSTYTIYNSPSKKTTLSEIISHTTHALQELQDYTESRKLSYPKLKIISSETKDLEGNTAGYYRSEIADFWSKTEDKSCWQSLNITNHELTKILDTLYIPADSQKTYYILPYLNIESVTEIDFENSEWEISDHKEEINCDFLSFHYSSIFHQNKKKWEIKQSLRIKKFLIFNDDINYLNENIGKIYSSNFWTLTRPINKSNGLSWKNAFWGSFLIYQIIKYFLK